MHLPIGLAMNQKYPFMKVGQKVNSWTVRVITLNTRGVKVFICQCSCGSWKNCNYDNVRSGKSRSCIECGNKRGGEKGKRYTDVVPDDELRHRLLLKIHGAFTRCNSEDFPQYKDWGGRGVKVKFPDVKSFLSHLITLPGHDDDTLTLDRIDNNGHYEPGNLRFATMSVNINNRRSW